MALALQLDSQPLLPWLEEVTYRSVRTNGEESACYLNAARYPGRTGERDASWGVYTSADEVWTIQTAELEAAGLSLETGGVAGSPLVPKPRDIITDAAETNRTVLEATYSPVLLFWKLTTRNLAVQFDLKDLLTIEVSTELQGPTGATYQSAWTAKYANLPGRAEPVAEEEDASFGKSGPRRRYTVFVDRQIDPRNPSGDWGRVKVNGLTLDITGYHEAERIGDLPVIDAVLKP